VAANHRSSGAGRVRYANLIESWRGPRRSPRRLRPRTCPAGVRTVSGLPHERDPGHQQCARVDRWIVARQVLVHADHSRWDGVRTCPELSGRGSARRPDSSTKAPERCCVGRRKFFRARVPEWRLVPTTRGTLLVQVSVGTARSVASCGKLDATARRSFGATMVIPVDDFTDSRGSTLSGVTPDRCLGRAITAVTTNEVSGIGARLSAQLATRRDHCWPTRQARFWLGSARVHDRDGTDGRGVGRHGVPAAGAQHTVTPANVALPDARHTDHLASRCRRCHQRFRPSDCGGTASAPTRDQHSVSGCPAEAVSTPARRSACRAPKHC
jgi:hypothetical protein